MILGIILKSLTTLRAITTYAFYMREASVYTMILLLDYYSHHTAYGFVLCQVPLLQLLKDHPLVDAREAVR